MELKYLNLYNQFKQSNDVLDALGKGKRILTIFLWIILGANSQRPKTGKKIETEISIMGRD